MDRPAMLLLLLPLLLTLVTARDRTSASVARPAPVDDWRILVVVVVSPSSATKEEGSTSLV